MKLILTSAGISNDSLAKALKKLVKGKIKIAFIPTAANVENGDKKWLIKDYKNCEKLGTVDIVDISALEKKIWLPRLKQANVIFMGGGNTVYLMKCLVKSGLKKELPKLLKKRIYVGISAGSIIASKKLYLSSDYIFNYEKMNVPYGLGYVDFNIRPHLNSQHFPRIREKYLIKALKNFHENVYALDDNSGIVCIDGKVKIVSEGKWQKY